MKTNALLAAVAIVVLNAGCASTFEPANTHESSSAQPVGSAADIQGLDLKKYDVVTVVAFGVEPGSKLDPIYGERFAAEVYGRLKHDFGNLFPEVRFGEPEGRTNELIVTGTMKAYTSFNLDAVLILRDGATQKTLFNADVNKLAVFQAFLLPVAPVLVVDRTFLRAAAAVANTVARGRGWQPSGQSPEEKQPLH